MREEMTDKNHDLSIRKQCELLDLNRSTLFYQPKPMSEFNLDLMDNIDKLYIDHPFLGSRRMSVMLSRADIRANRKRVQRLMRIMGIQAVFPKRNLSVSAKTDKKYPYLLKGLKIDHPNQVWSTDITYIRIGGGYAYLVAVIDWFSRKVLSWRLSSTMDTSFCLEALNEALVLYGNPEIFNTDQGSQFTSEEFTWTLEQRKIRISHDSKGRAFDNIFIERLWRTVKYEDIYIKHYETMNETRAGLNKFFKFYNNERPHQNLWNLTPDEVYGKVKVAIKAA